MFNSHHVRSFHSSAPLFGTALGCFWLQHPESQTCSSRNTQVPNQSWHCVVSMLVERSNLESLSISPIRAKNQTEWIAEVLFKDGIELLSTTGPVIPHNSPKSFSLGRKSSQMSKSRTVCTLRPLVSHLGEKWWNAVFLVWWLRGVKFCQFFRGTRWHRSRSVYISVYEWLNYDIVVEIWAVDGSAMWCRVLKLSWFVGQAARVTPTNPCILLFMHTLSHGLRHAFWVMVRWQMDS